MIQKKLKDRQLVVLGLKISFAQLVIAVISLLFGIVLGTGATYLVTTTFIFGPQINDLQETINSYNNDNSYNAAYIGQSNETNCTGVTESCTGLSVTVN